MIPAVSEKPVRYRSKPRASGDDPQTARKTKGLIE